VGAVPVTWNPGEGAADAPAEVVDELDAAEVEGYVAHLECRCGKRWDTREPEGYRAAVAPRHALVGRGQGRRGDNPDPRQGVPRFPYRCRRCGLERVYRVETLTEAFLEAYADGRSRIVVDVDV
jgi:hypothetical protein